MKSAVPPTRVSASLTRLRERMQWLWHSWREPSARKLADPRSALAGRDYYELYEDVYRQVQEGGGSPEREAEQQQAWALMYRDFEAMQAELPRPPATLIDLGCGEGINAIHFAELGYRVTGIDISPTAIAVAKEKAARSGQDIDFRVGSILDLAGIPDGAFDLALDIGCLHMLVRTQHREAYLRSALRVLRPRGAFFLFDRVFPKDVTVEDEEQLIWKSITFVRSRFHTHQGVPLPERACGFRGASLEQYRRELEGAGFEVRSLFCGPGEHSRFATMVVRRGDGDAAR